MYFAQSLITLSLGQNHIGNIGAEHLAQALQHNQVIQQLLLFSSTESFIHYFSQTLTTLDINGNQIGDDGAEHLANTLQQNQVVQFLLFFNLS